MYIPDKPGQSHNMQDFESTLSEVRFLFIVPGCWEGWGALCEVRWGHTYWGKGWGTQRDSVKYTCTYWDGRGLGVGVITKFMYKMY